MSGFASLIQGLVKTAITIADDLASQVVYTYVSGAPVYDPATGATTTPTTTYAFTAVISKFGQNEADNNVVIATDAKMVCSTLDLPVEPTVSDTMAANGKNWSIQRELGTPGNAARIVHIREV
jgi:hypothetical protein